MIRPLTHSDVILLHLMTTFISIALLLIRHLVSEEKKKERPCSLKNIDCKKCMFHIMMQRNSKV